MPRGPRTMQQANAARVNKAARQSTWNLEFGRHPRGTSERRREYFALPQYARLAQAYTTAHPRLRRCDSLGFGW